MHKISINYPLLVFIVALILCLQNIWGPSIYILDEAKNATCAREMMVSTDHIVPTYNYQLRTDKPPLHYYFMMASYKVFGVNAFGARFFSAVFGALTILITFLYSRKLFSQEIALLTSFVLMSSLHFILQFHLAVPDPYLIFFLTLSGFAFFDGIENNRSKQIYLAYVAMGFGVLTKGPVAIVLPAFSLIVYLLLTKNFTIKKVFKLKPFIGALIVLIVAVPWYLLVGLRTDWEWVKGFFIEHNIDRFSDPKEGHGGAFFITWVFVFGGLLPMSVFIIQSIRNWWQNRSERFLFYCGIYALTVIAFFTIADTRLPNYTVPAYPFLAVVLSSYLLKVICGAKQFRWFKISSIIAFFIYLLIPVGVYFGLSADPNFAHLNSVWIYFLIVAFTGVVGLFMIYRKKITGSIITMGVGYMLFTAIAMDVVFPKIDAENPVQAALPILDDNRPMVYFHRLNPSFPFHIDKQIIMTESMDDLEAFITENPDTYLFTRDDFADSIRSKGAFKEIFNERELFEPKRIVIFEKE